MPEGEPLLARLTADVAALAAAQGNALGAARLAGAAEQLRLITGVAAAWPERMTHDQGIAAARSALGDAIYEQAIAAGRALPRSQLLAELAAVLDHVSALAAASSASPPDARPAPPAEQRLTPRERDVLRLLIAGKSDREIAAALSISYRTATFHVANILAKLDVPSRTAAVAVALQQGMR
jgi:DNA-binding NarL/FixJ family response regulator